MATTLTAADLPTYLDLILPTIRAVEALGGSAKASEITRRLTEDLEATEEQLALTYPTRDKSIYVDRMDWARSYAKLSGALDSPARGVFLLTALGRELAQMPEHDAAERVLELDSQVRSRRRKARVKVPAIRSEPKAEIEDPGDPESDDHSIGSDDWKGVLLKRLHRMTPDAFEEFVLYVLRLYGLELQRVGGTGDEGIDGIGTAPISPVLSSRVAVQVKRYDPAGKSIGRETVALFQRDAQTQGAERAILVTLGRFSGPARNAANRTTPTVDLIDGDRLSELILEQELGVHLAPSVNERWFDRFD